VTDTKKPGVGRVGYDETIVIQGAGGLGLNATVVANECGAETIVVDSVDARLKQATAFGADIGIEVAGVPAAFVAGIELVRKGGRYLEMGNVRPGYDVETRVA
jgi:D-arabinose 1-dehydrogenase-like Zn-dependent alcohol dehydrogenase